MFAELDITSNFTFLTGGSHPEEYMERAALLGLPAIAIADENSVAGIVRAHTHAREIARQVKLRTEAESNGPIGPQLPENWSPHRPFDDYPGSSQRRKHPIARFETIPDRPPPSAAIRTAPRLIPAARIVLPRRLPVTALPRDRAAWGRLCRLLSTGRLRAAKGDCDLHLADLLDWGEGMELLLHPPRQRGLAGLAPRTPTAPRPPLPRRLSPRHRPPLRRAGRAPASTASPPSRQDARPPHRRHRPPLPAPRQDAAASPTS